MGKTRRVSPQYVSGIAPPPPQYIMHLGCQGKKIRRQAHIYCFSFFFSECYWTRRVRTRPFLSTYLRMETIYQARSSQPGHTTMRYGIQYTTVGTTVARTKKTKKDTLFFPICASKKNVLVFFFRRAWATYCTSDLASTVFNTRD